MLIELMVAIIVAGMLAISLCQSLSLTKEASFGAHGRVICAAVAQEIAERLRDTPYLELPSTSAGAVTIPIQVYSDSLVTPLAYPWIQQPALMMDLDSTKYVWSQQSVTNRFPISSSVTFTSGPYPGSTTAAISVNAVNVHSSYSTSVLLTHFGIQRNEN
jgi:hypothetical protein